MSQLLQGINNESNSDKREEVLNKIKEEVSRIRNYTPKVAVFGDTGVGKSSLCNALFGKEIAEISDVEACTRAPQKIMLAGKENGIVLIDVPGIGENPERHKEYRDLYKSLVPDLDLVLWAIKADDRKYATSIEVYKEILKPKTDKCPVIFVITQADKIEPHRKWNQEENKPGDEQLVNIQKKIIDVSSSFEVSAKQIVPVSASDSWNLVELVNRVVEILPNEKKYAFTRETKEENVSEEAAKEAEKGVFEKIKETAGEFWDFVKDDVFNFVKDTVFDVLKRKIPRSIWSIFN